MGRKKLPGHRTPSGQISRVQGARGAHDDVAINQPHRRPFADLLGEAAARSWAASFALGRARLIGEAEALHGVTKVRAALFKGRPHSENTRAFGISERMFFAGLRYAADVGRERWVRSAPKDKPSALSFLSARGLSLSGHEPGADEAQAIIVSYEEAVAALTAAPCSSDLRSVIRTLRQSARRLGAGDMVALLRGMGALMNPAASGAIKRAVDTLVIDDRDVDLMTLDVARIGLAVLADHYYGTEREDYRPIKGTVSERPIWMHDGFTSLEFVYRHADGSPRKAGEAEKQETRGASRGGWKGRHQSLAG